MGTESASTTTKLAVTAVVALLLVSVPEGVARAAFGHGLPGWLLAPLYVVALVVVYQVQYGE